jgi:hypothetical protein
MSKSKCVCAAFPRPASSPTNYLNNDSRRRGITIANKHLAYGATCLQDISFCLVVDNFGIKSTSRDHVLHLKTTLEKHYTVAMDWGGSLFCGINID